MSLFAKEDNYPYPGCGVLGNVEFECQFWVCAFPKYNKSLDMSENTKIYTNKKYILRNGIPRFSKITIHGQCSEIENDPEIEHGILWVR